MSQVTPEECQIRTYGGMKMATPIAKTLPEETAHQPVEAEIWAEGKRHALVCILVDDYGRVLVASAEMERITEAQVKQALGHKYPDVTWTTRTDHSFGYVYAQGRRRE